MVLNPWNVTSIQAFSCLKCPECEFYTKEENYFENHAILNHPSSSVLFETAIFETHKDLLYMSEDVSPEEGSNDSMPNIESEKALENYEEEIKNKEELNTETTDLERNDPHITLVTALCGESRGIQLREQ